MRESFCDYKIFSLFQSQVGCTLAFLWGESNLESNLKEGRRSWSQHERTLPDHEHTKYTFLLFNANRFRLIEMKYWFIDL